jgi:hypothetical protein
LVLTEREQQETGEHCMMNSLMFGTVHEMVLDWVGHKAYSWGRREMHKAFWWGWDSCRKDTISKTGHMWKVNFKMNLPET